MSTITSANSTFMLSVANLFATSQALSGYATDDAFAADAVDIAEVLMGVDGKMSAGYTPAIFPITVAFQADSPSILLFDTWGGAQIAAREIYPATAVIALPATGKVYTIAQAILVNFKPLPDAKKVLGPQHYKLMCGMITSTPI